MALSPEVLNSIPAPWRAQVEAFIRQGALREDQVPALIEHANRTGFLPSSNFERFGGPPTAQSVTPLTGTAPQALPTGMPGIHPAIQSLLNSGQISQADVPAMQAAIARTQGVPAQSAPAPGSLSPRLHSAIQ